MEKIGRYELLREIGHGGMGKVYLARDTSPMGQLIGRDVAIKVMLERQTDPGMRDRFFREAKAAGNLAHQNIVTIHDLAIDDGTPYIVMEYLEGVNLAEWLVHDRVYDLVDRLSALCGEGGSDGKSTSTVRLPTPDEGERLASALEGLAHDLPDLRPDVYAALGRLQEFRSPIQPRTTLDLLETARDVLWPVATRPEDDRAMTIAERLAVGKQIADGLAFAHRKGVVHRDIKPGNIQLVNGFHLQHGLHVKILDFGIAQIDSQQSRTKGAPPGTPRYMSPEQCQGNREELNHRTDIWSLGVMLYETLAGRHAFDGDTSAALSYRIVHEPHVPVSKVNPAVPESVSQVVSRALAKKPADRFQDATDLSRALQACIEEIALTADGPEDQIRRAIERILAFARNLSRQGKFDQAEKEARRVQDLEELQHSSDSAPDTASRADEVISEISAARERAAREQQGLAHLGEAREHLALQGAPGPHAAPHAEVERRRSEEEERPARERDQTPPEHTAWDAMYIHGDRMSAPAGVGDPTLTHPHGGLLERVITLPKHRPFAAGSAGLAVIAVLLWFVGAVDAPAPVDPDDRSDIVALPTGGQENRPPEPDDRSAGTIAATAGLSDAPPAASATPSEDAPVEPEPAEEVTEAPESSAEPAPAAAAITNVESDAPADTQLDAPESITETPEPAASVDTPPAEPVGTVPPDASPTPEQGPARAEPTTPAAPPPPRNPAPGGLRGTVRDGSAGVADVTVRLVGHNSEGVLETTTSDGGAYELFPIPPGEYTVLFIRDGETVYERLALSIGEGRFLTLGISLEPADAS